ncbi:MAG: 3-dehydroquinate synthase [Provencibacterium sp.]|jgi:3-dehydroquinate synthase|nr:3-dehydroquinate synthase [Provencibacterium sp.]
MQKITVHTSAPYDILIGGGLLEEAGERLAALAPGAAVAVVTDDQVDRYYGDALLESLRRSGIRAAKYVFPHGEASKSLPSAERLYQFFSENEITRKDLAVALGGGVAGDLAGFAAATWLRGVRYVQIPTTFLAAIDSSVGGKTAVDIPAGKNLVGAFWQPSLVLCDPRTLDTLSDKDFADGAAEAIKYAAIFDRPLLDLLADGRARERLDTVIARCIQWKREVVEEDERDTGRRQLLNFGHTLGHAIEKLSHFSVSHGQGVAVGMVELTRRTEALGLTEPGCAEILAKALAAYRLPTRYEGGLGELCPAILGDKKRKGGRITFITLQTLGHAVLTDVDAGKIAPFLGAE